MSTYKRGNLVTHYCTFLDLSQQEPLAVVNPKITIRHVDDSFVLVTDVLEANMTLASETTYYFQWNIPSNAYVGTYNVECEAILDGVYGESNETIQVTR